MTPKQRENFERLMRPRHIAFVGGADAAVAIGEARRRGFAGSIWPVNPRRETLAGLPCVASLDDLPEAPDAVFLAIPSRPAVDAIGKLAAMGAGGVACYTAGFREAGGEGAALEDALRTAAREMALIGPNCYGMINYLDGVALWPFAHGGECPGYGAAVITQSGMFSSDITMSQRALPLTHMISAGNQTVLALEDFLEVLSGNPAVRAIGLHIEGLRDVAKFERAAVAAIRGGTPVVALKTGRSQIGASLTQSHTGSLSGTKELYDALFDRCGVISVSSPSQFIETLKYLCVAGPPKGTKVMGFTCSGGGATMLADHSETIGLSYPAFGAEDRTLLQGLLPDIATVSNPLDYTTPIWGQPEHTRPVFTEAVARSGADVAILVQDYPALGLDETRPAYLADAMAFADAAEAADVPAAICSTIHENMDAETRKALIARGIAPMQGIHEALNAVAQAARWAEARARIEARTPRPLLNATLPDRIEMIHEANSKAMLREAGISLPEGLLVSGAEAAQSATTLGFPVALKMMSSRLAHKTEAGAVKLDLSSAAEVARAVEDMRAEVTRHDPSALSDLFLIERMAAPPVAEMIVGIRRDPQFGMSMMVGSGGILVELLKDTATLVLPASAEDIRHAVEGLRLAKLLGGFRGKPKVDLDALAARLAALGDFALARADRIAEIEINPLFVYATGVTAVDALISVVK
ncbi:acetate--CoA ligase family protein (plasmid) [Aminobacter sp. SR38]|jgi:acyl-CoA synthetase (NDP forming)|uniref:acetate--CoA ligase family protein n=1 Tax=Aminobacter sp. SR38 TaxID=2774562 RepID=UPI001781032B|nr:acetate--CoA ligase family protein [Aminobacter sp. SR38]QOF75076.1 acetate--CoA ligase family protein [Aminobacter sp. SR38]